MSSKMLISNHMVSIKVCPNSSSCRNNTYAAVVSVSTVAIFFLSRSDNIMPPTLSFIVQLKQIKLDHCGIYSSIDNYLGCMFSINTNGFVASEPVCIFKKLNLLALTHDTKSRSLQTSLVSIGHQECFDS